jgi:rhodanese-related sulfurtransferase
MNETHIATVNVHELKTQMDSDAALCVIDVREHEEWNNGHIPGAQHIPRGELPSQTKNLPEDKNLPIYLHCRGGTRSLMAAEFLKSLGYSCVYSVNGGIRDWESSGYPIVKS